MTQEVIAADREAAASICVCGDMRAILRDGRMDDHGYVQAFAAHRLTHLPNTDLSEERMREILKAAPWPGADDKFGMVPVPTALRAMQQYAAGLQGEVERLRDGLQQIATATDDTDASILRYVARTALGDTQ
ncbi:MAG: hypothetical protein EON59_16025 [Alphaproteobacteria bacterium]|nr:MAG: hypothetical protein EON59_16025 [Alphaproteobacteria bacterium]